MLLSFKGCDSKFEVKLSNLISC